MLFPDESFRLFTAALKQEGFAAWPLHGPDKAINRFAGNYVR